MSCFTFYVVLAHGDSLISCLVFYPDPTPDTQFPAHPPVDKNKTFL